jgi:hypothetical protein
MRLLSAFDIYTHTKFLTLRMSNKTADEWLQSRDMDSVILCPVSYVKPVFNKIGHEIRPGRNDAGLSKQYN